MAGRSFALALAVVGVAGCASTVEVRPAAESLAPTVATVVGLPLSIGWGGDADVRRIQRRTSDSLIAATGGHAVIAEELITGEDDAAVTAALKGLGEDPARALTFTIGVAMGGRMMNGVSPIPGFIVGKRLVVDYHATIEVRHLGSREVIGTVETITSGAPNEPEIGPDGEKHAAMEALDAALTKAVATFAPRLSASGPVAEIVEIPAEAAGSVTKRLTTLGTLYPELSLDEMQALGQSRERFLVRAPGPLLAFGIARGDLLGVPGGVTAASRAALARAVARGLKPALAVVRGGQRYVLASAEAGARR
ncbi:MAG TPA: hypothetical protein VH853_11365 [Polyangia bacterium]|jgi:hypothetical protein|nr:hypothetical protein [Polyangia bacterium]